MQVIVPHTGFLMATLQIRDLPDPLHQMLQLRARQHRRSLSQQALSDLQQAFGGDGRERRRQALADLQALALAAGTPVFDPSPEELIREGRQLGWAPRWDFATTVERSVGWYMQVQVGAGSALEWCQADLAPYPKVPNP